MLFSEGMLPLKQVSERRNATLIHHTASILKLFSCIVHCDSFLTVSKVGCIALACSVQGGGYK